MCFSDPGVVTDDQLRTGGRRRRWRSWRGRIGWRYRNGCGVGYYRLWRKWHGWKRLGWFHGWNGHGRLDGWNRLGQ